MMSDNRIAISLVCAFLFGACGKPKAVQPVLPTGEARLPVDGGSIWYRITGEHKGVPVVLLHGGPGMSSYYLKSLEDLGTDRQVIRYDQLGGGKSDNLTDTTKFTIDHFVMELDSLRHHLGCPTWHLYGHSWGTILALEYYRQFPDRVSSLTFGSAVFDIPAFEQRAKELLGTLPLSSQKIVQDVEASGNFDDPSYQAVIEEFYGQYVFRNPVKEDLDSTFATMNQGIYVYMQGPSEFTIVGTLKKYDSTPFLPSIKVPTLFTVGEFDEVGPSIVKSFADKVPGAQYHLFPGAAHITTWDARNENIQVVRDFLRMADSLASR